MTRKHALVVWTREQKTGIEELSHVPDNSRFANAVTAVRYEGDNKFYPAKVIMISENVEELEKKSVEVEEEIEKAKEAETIAAAKSSKRPKRRRRAAVTNGVASDKDVAAAVGGKAPIPKQLQEAHGASLKETKEAKASFLDSQFSSDHQVLKQVKKSLFPPIKESGNRNETRGSDLSSEGESGSDEGEDSDKDEMEKCKDEDNSEINASQSGSNGVQWCDCKPCLLLKKYDKPEFRNFFSDLVNLYGCVVPVQQMKFLELLPIPSGVRKVKLCSDKDILIAESDKNQLRVDFANKPAKLAKETLFRLFGKEAFQNLTVTGRGTKDGSYTISSKVLQAVQGFVNENVVKANKVSTTSLVALINKRAPEWRKGQSPKISSPKFLTKPDRKKKMEKAAVPSPSRSLVPLNQNTLSPLKSPKRVTFQMSTTIEQPALEGVTSASVQAHEVPGPASQVAPGYPAPPQPYYNWNWSRDWQHQQAGPSNLHQGGPSHQNLAGPSHLNQQWYDPRYGSYHEGSNWTGQVHPQPFWPNQENCAQ